MTTRSRRVINMNEYKQDYQKNPPNTTISLAALPSDYSVGGVLRGLVKRCKSDRIRISPLATVKIYADLTRVKISEMAGDIPAGRGGVRQPVTQFTPASRRNMLQAMSECRTIGKGEFVHLTFPGMATIPAKFVVTQESAKLALAAFRKRLVRRLPDVSGIWRLELKKRLTGASKGLIVPHFHVMLFNVNWVDKAETLREWVARNWNEIIDPSDLKHRQAGTTVDLIVNRRHAMAYASKYTAKSSSNEDIGLWGRRWGTFGKIERYPVMVFECPADKLLTMRRDLRKLLNSRAYQSWVRAWNNQKTVGLVCVHPVKHSYSKKLARGSPDKGFSALGLGDLSGETWTNITQSTIWRMIPPLSETIELYN